MDKKHVCLTNQSESVPHFAQDDLQWTLATGNGQSIASGLSASKQDQGDKTIDNLEVIKPSINHPQVWGWNRLKLGIPWLYHGYTMVIPWLYHGYTMLNEEWPAPKQFRHEGSIRAKSEAAIPSSRNHASAHLWASPTTGLETSRDDGWISHGLIIHRGTMELWAIMGMLGIRQDWDVSRLDIWPLIRVMMCYSRGNP
jgi:hypothetical protein